MNPYLKAGKTKAFEWFKTLKELNAKYFVDVTMDNSPFHRSDLVVGIYANRSYDHSFFQSEAYLNYAQLFGTAIIIGPGMQKNMEAIIKCIDVLIVPGGRDVDARRYANFVHNKNGNPNLTYERFDVGHNANDDGLLEMWLETGKPTIGICRGFQTINVIAGGVMTQHVNGHQNDADDAHKVYIAADHNVIPLKRGFIQEISVNSRHHQAVLENQLAADFYAIGKEADSKFKKKAITTPLVEIYASKTRPIICAQYHPEDIIEPYFTAQAATIINQYYPSK